MFWCLQQQQYLNEADHMHKGNTLGKSLTASWLSIIYPHSFTAPHSALLIGTLLINKSMFSTYMLLYNKATICTESCWAPQPACPVNLLGIVYTNINQVDQEILNCCQNAASSSSGLEQYITVRVCGTQIVMGGQKLVCSLVPRLLFTERENSLVNCLYRFGSNILKSL